MDRIPRNPSPASRLPLLLLLALLGSGARRAEAAWPYGPVTNLAVCSATANQFSTAVAPDGSGGAFVVWADQRGGNADIYAQRIDRDGNVLWAPDGVPVCTAAGDQTAPVIASDLYGSVYVVWEDRRAAAATRDLYAQRIQSNGTPAWAFNGVPAIVVPDPNDEFNACVAYDSTLGYLNVAWQDGAAGNYNIYAQILDFLGVQHLPAGGLLICGAANDQKSPRCASLGAGYAVIAWEDRRSGTDDLYAQRLQSGGALGWTSGGLAVCVAPAGQTGARVVAGAGGASFIAWADVRSGTSKVYAQRLTFGGAPAFAVDGIAVGSGGASQFSPGMIPDGQGGVIIAWNDFFTPYYGLFVQRISPFGVLGWGASGIPVAPAPGGGEQFSLAPDGSGGALLGWLDRRTGGNTDVYAQRVDAAGTIRWTTGGLAVCTLPTTEDALASATDDAGGQILAWSDGRGNFGFSRDIYAQRVDRYGVLSGEPKLTGVRDVANDEGGHVKVSWNASPLDTDPLDGRVQEYYVLRSVPTSLAEQKLAAGARWVTPEAIVNAEASALIRIEQEGVASAWEWIGFVPAFHAAQYSFVAPTTSDSIAIGNPLTAFAVLARAASGTQFWLSNPDSGYSVDDLAPATPAPFTGVRLAGVTHLDWGANGEADLAGYRLYRGTDAAFVPGPGNLVAALATTDYADAGPAASFYRLSAVDTHGNESAFALLAPSGTLDAPGAAPASLWLAPLAPNPARGPVEFRFGLPGESRVRLSIFDAQGRLVCTILDATLPAGEHHARWAGVAVAGARSSNGVFFYRFEAGDRVIKGRFARLE